jgi:broad specificity phosphatase PhoE
MDSGTILIMRHAEKSDDPLDPDLSPAGRERARQLAGWLPATFGKPSFLFATAVSKHSRRPIETLEPLSQACGLTIDMSFADQDYGALAHLLRKTPIYEGALTVVCWHHGNIPSLARALKANDGDYPDPWNPSVFDLILELDFAAGAPQVKPVKEPF